MEISEDKFHFPKDRNLKSSPLIEAWFEVRWKLEQGSIPQTWIDPEYPFALGVFYKDIKERYEYHEELETSKAPEGFFPHNVQHRFRVSKDGWPVLQLGPGVATANYVGDYTWYKFHKTILFLRKNLLNAYQNKSIEASGLFLRYKNSFPFDYSQENLFSFISKNLNLSITVPQHIPGQISSSSNPTDSNLRIVYNLKEPISLGRIEIGSGISQKSDGTEEKIVILMFEISSTNINITDFTNEDKLTDWLNKAHSVIHEWFFSFIDGPLYSKFSGDKI